MAETDWTNDNTQMWPDITSPVARRVLSAVFHTGSAAYDTSAQFLGMAELEVRNDFRQRLRESGLAQRIAAGPQMMPLIYDYMPWLRRQLTQHEVPKTPEQLAVHILHNLEWYLDKPKPVGILPGAAVYSFLIVLFLMGCLVFLASDLYAAGILIAAASFFIALWFAFSSQVSSQVADQIWRSEYFYYLRETYGEVRLDGDLVTSIPVIADQQADAGFDHDDLDSAFERD